MKFSRFPTRLLGSLAFALATLLVAPAAHAQVATTENHMQGSSTITAPTNEQRQKAAALVEAAKRADPQEFAKKMDMLRKSTALREYLGSVPGYDVTQQMEFAATQLPTETVEAFILLTDQGSVKLRGSR
jgi:hypothetical protein